MVLEKQSLELDRVPATTYWGKKRITFMPVSGILAIVTLVSYAVKDVSPVVGLTGAILGSFIRVFFSLKFTRAMAIVNGYDSL